jgi:hypothetical protein
LLFSSNWPARSAGVKLQSASASFPKIRCPVPHFLAWPGSFGALSFFPLPAHCSSRSNKNVLPSKILLRALLREGSFGYLRAVRLEPECTMRSGGSSVHHRRPGSNLWQPHTKSHANENSHLNEMIALRRRVNRLGVRNLLKRQKGESIRNLTNSQRVSKSPLT